MPDIHDLERQLGVACFYLLWAWQKAKMVHKEDKKINCTYLSDYRCQHIIEFQVHGHCFSLTFDLAAKKGTFPIQYFKDIHYYRSVISDAVNFVHHVSTRVFCYRSILN